MLNYMIGMFHLLAYFFGNFKDVTAQLFTDCTHHGITVCP